MDYVRSNYLNFLDLNFNLMHPRKEMKQYLILVDDAEEEEAEESIDRLFECLDESSGSSSSSGSNSESESSAKKKSKKKNKKGGKKTKKARGLISIVKLISGWFFHLHMFIDKILRRTKGQEASS